MSFNFLSKISLLILFNSIFVFGNNISNQNKEVYKNYYYAQELDFNIYNNFDDCYNNIEDYYNFSTYYFIDCECNQIDCFNKLIGSNEFLSTNYSSINYNISKCIKENYGDYCFKCNNLFNNETIYIDYQLYYYNYYCLFNRFIIGVIVFTLIITFIILILKKNEKKIILIRKKRQYNQL